MEEVREVDEMVESFLGHPSILHASPQPLFKLYLLGLTRGLYFLFVGEEEEEGQEPEGEEINEREEV
jgi:hypothetical protein